MFTKYPRTAHLPWSGGLEANEVIMPDSASCFGGREVVVTEKMDGENTTLYCDGMHSRSLNSGSHVSRDYVKAMHATIASQIPAGMRVCGENLYAVHSIEYASLASYFQVFGIWEGNTCLSWADTVEYAALLGLEVVKVLYVGIWNEKLIKSLYVPGTEGYVVRLSGSFDYDSFQESVAKYVRPNHVQTSKHWRHEVIRPNALALDSRA